MSEAPFFSVIIPTYNRAHLIREALDSVLRQEFTDFEVLVVDDGSNDETEEVVRAYSDQRMHYFTKENGERGAARNFGLQRAKGKYINFFDSDDLMYPKHLSAAKETIDQLGYPEFFHLGYDFRTPDGAVTRVVNDFDETTRETILFDNVLSCNGVIVRRDVMEEFPFEEDRRLASAEDWELWIRLISRFPLFFSNTVTTSVVSHDQRSLQTINADKIIERDTFLINRLESDVDVMKMFGTKFNKFIAQRYTFIMLCLSENGRKKECWNWARKAISRHPPILFSKRFIASLIKF